MVRDNWVCLNGRWDCTFSNEAAFPQFYAYTILVPFSPETELSGIGRTLQPNEYLWYRRYFTYKPKNGNRVLLHFEAVDYVCTVYLNGVEVKSHEGGYLPFSCDITDVLSQNNELIVRVLDPSDTKPIIRGKQRLKPGGIFYPAQSGIWQTVWLEEVRENYIQSIIIKPELSQKCWFVTVHASKETQKVAIQYLGGTKIIQGLSGQRLSCQVEEVHTWSPEDPYLYEFTVTMGEDSVTGYVGMRSFGVEGLSLLLNGERYYQHGILNQGYWPQSLYTAPTDQACIDDLLLIKKLGFNMLRMHAKIESRRFYYHCDRLGLLVWQDMVSGGEVPRQPVMSAPLFVPAFNFKDTKYGWLGSTDTAYRHQFEIQLRQMIGHLYNSVSVALWVVFNEGWGQFDSEKMLSLVEQLDGSRPVDSVSGWYDQQCGAFTSKHVYFKPYHFKKDALGRATLLSEFGGYVYRIPGHDMQKEVFGYRNLKDRQAFNDAFFELYASQVAPAKKQGLAASVYTQVSDVEQELNGLVTYDRLEVKLDLPIALQVAAMLFGGDEG